MRKYLLFCPIGLLACATLLLTGRAEAQRPPSVYAIVGARIEIGDGRVIEKGTIVLRDGVIVAVGADVKPPTDAEVIKGEGLVVYPGFIDAYSNAGLALPEAKPQQDTPPDASLIASPSMREANRKGVRPELRAVDYLALGDGQLTPLRQNGFTTQLIIPSDGMINGQGVLVNLSGRPRRESVIRRKVGFGFGFNAGAGGNYPGSLMGIIAHVRQTLLDAQYYALQLRAFEKTKTLRPPDDEVLETLQEPLTQKAPVLFDADTEFQIVRAIKISEEFHLPLMLAGCSEAFLQIERLKSHPTPILLSLNFGKEPVADEEIPATAQAELKAKWQERVGNAVVLAKASLPFAFSTKGLKSPAEFWENLRRVIKAGLPRDTALRALSLQPAQFLGVDRLLGTVEVGKSVALTVMNGDFVDAKTKVSYLFIDREKFDLIKENTPPPAPVRPRRNRQDNDDDPNGEGSHR